MVDEEKQENLANARRKLKKFRDQQQPNLPEPNENNVHPSNTPSVDSMMHQNMIPQSIPNFMNEQQFPLNGAYQAIPQLPNVNFERPLDQQHQYGVVIENPKQDKSQRLSSDGSNMSRRFSQTSVDAEQKLRRDNEHLQEQLEMHMQTIGILVADKSDMSAKLTQSFKQLERKQSEMDELYGRLKASRERVQELEKEIQNSTSNVQKREMAAKESDKENDRLKIENIRQSQLIEDLKQTITELNGKLHDRQISFDQLNTELQQLKIQSQLNTETSEVEQHIKDLQQSITLKDTQIEELHSSLNRIRSDNEQYQKHNADMQYHIQDLTNQINQLTQANKILQDEQNEMKLNDRSSVVEYDTLQQQNELFRNAIDQWSNRYEDLRVKLEQMTKLMNEKDELITELKQSKDSPSEKNDEEYTKNLKNQLEIIEESNKQLNERLEQIQSKSINQQETQTNNEIRFSPPSSTDSTHNSETSTQLLETYQQIMHENIGLKDQIQHLEHVILQLQNETDTIGDYIRLYQQQREQLQKRYQEKDDCISQLTQDKCHLQEKISQLETLMIQTLNIPVNQSNSNGQLETNHHLLPQFTDETKARILTIIKELGQNNISVVQNKDSSVKLAFVDQNFYICSTCSGVVQHV
ncbi:unnamed protein product [Adineta ricciae]|uniref:Golgin subfamily A conserved domain-containing protein n=1 Tax=Adineta ricciae TaxID=249248 RepID=A0A814T3X7_ADIRI|nr:unnamed protein product [Adineta ricciae]CAF1272941.1 unnamed protein product [Adineta ricciae]